MFKLKIYCNDGHGFQYWEDGNGTYETYDKALIACYENALCETQELMMDANGYRWFEVNMDFEITDTYANKCLELGTIIPVAAVCYDHAPWDRENDCDIEIITGYTIVEIQGDSIILDKYNAMLKEKYGQGITVKLASYIEDDGSEWYSYTSTKYGDDHNTFKTIEEAYEDACVYLDYVGELW